MDQPDIAPLARRLAEENNVDWRRLNGSGDDGRVVERDVLEYLARVMAGDEAVDPTPEPVPDGMQAWPDADVRAGEAEAARDDVELTSTIEDDIFLFDEPPSDEDGDEELGDDLHDVGARRAVHEARDDDAVHEPASDDDDDDDLLWSDGGAVDVDVEHEIRAAMPPVDVDDLEEDLLVAGDDDAETLQDASTEPPISAVVETGSSVGDDDALGLPDLFGAGPSRHEGGDAPPMLFADDDDGADVAPSARSTGPVLGDETHDGPALADETPMSTVPSIDEPPATIEALDDVPADLAVSLAEAHLRTGDPTDTHGADALGDASVHGDDVAVAPPVAMASSHVGHDAIGRDVPLLRHGHVWRRQVDLTALVSAQADLAADLGRDDPVPIGAFLLRAAQKALMPRGGAVAVATIDANDVRRARTADTNDFASTVVALDRALASGASEVDGPVDLVVADLSELGIDDAVLHLDAPVLTLGRMLIDNQSGGRRAYLSMSGDGSDGADAAKLLARVAELLEAPVRIVV